MSNATRSLEGKVALSPAGTWPGVALAKRYGSRFRVLLVDVSTECTGQPCALGKSGRRPDVAWIAQ